MGGAHYVRARERYKVGRLYGFINPRAPLKHHNNWYRTGGNFRGVLIFMDFMGPTQTTKNSLKICIDPRKYNFLGLKTSNLPLFYIMHIAMLCSYKATYIDIQFDPCTYI